MTRIGFSRIQLSAQNLALPIRRRRLRRGRGGRTEQFLKCPGGSPTTAHEPEYHCIFKNYF
jgi:hypothetical protein